MEGYYASLERPLPFYGKFSNKILVAVNEGFLYDVPNNYIVRFKHPCKNLIWALQNTTRKRDTRGVLCMVLDPDIFIKNIWDLINILYWLSVSMCSKCCNFDIIFSVLHLIWSAFQCKLASPTLGIWKTNVNLNICEGCKRN